MSGTPLIGVAGRPPRERIMSFRKPLKDLAAPTVSPEKSRAVRGGIIAVLIGLLRPRPGTPTDPVGPTR
jgi:hypothetical protein